MSNLDTWSEVIRQQGEMSREAETKRLDQMEAELPERVAAIPGMSNDELVERLLYFHGSRFNPRENTIRSKYHDALLTEVMKRLNQGGQHG